MPPAPHEYHGGTTIAAFLRASMRWNGPRTIRLPETRANHQPAFGFYLAAPDSEVLHPTGLIVLTISEDGIRGITRFLDQRLPSVFGLPGLS